MDTYNHSFRFLRGAVAIHSSGENPEKIFIQAMPLQLGRVKQVDQLPAQTTGSLLVHMKLQQAAQCSPISLSPPQA